MRSMADEKTAMNCRGPSLKPSLPAQFSKMSSLVRNYSCKKRHSLCNKTGRIVIDACVHVHQSKVTK